MVYLHPDLLTPDPTVGHPLEKIDDSWYGLELYPHHAINNSMENGSVTQWGKSLNLFIPHPALSIAKDYLTENDIIIDFGTEVEGELEVRIKTGSSGFIAVNFGESLEEVREWGLANGCPQLRPRKVHWPIHEGGVHNRLFEQGGFRFVRLRCADFTLPFVFERICVHAKFLFSERKGNFECSDKTFQRIWQSSVYTARLCSCPDSFWDGIKRDRTGWYGDARITKETIDTVYHEPSPGIAMMMSLPTDSWVDGIPNYSFDCLVMLKQHILFYGLEDPHYQDIWQKITEFFKWVLNSQVDDNGLITYRENQEYFMGIGFTDWSPMPLGGKFEELACLQFSWLECLRDAAILASWFKNTEKAALYDKIADRLASVFKKRFWEQQKGFHHTLNTCEPVEKKWEEPENEGEHYRKSYLENLQYGPSGPSRQSNARAYFAGLCGSAEKELLKQKVFGDSGIPEVITSYYQYYETWARAACGDIDGAICQLKTYFGSMLERHDSACIWESYRPYVTGVSAYALSEWPKSLCHGWGSGTVPVTRRFLLGVDILEPGMKKIRLSPESSLPWTFKAEMPTPYGIMKISKEEVNGPVVYDVPEGIEAEMGSGAIRK